MGHVSASKRVSSCTGKHAFKSYSQAAKAAGRAVKSHQHQERAPVASPYRCPACGAFHLGTSTVKARRPLPRVRRVEEEEEYL